MHAILISAGSRGDSEPFVALSKELLKYKDKCCRVDLWLQENWTNLAEALLDHPSFHRHALPFENSDYYKAVHNGPSAGNHPDKRMKHVSSIASICEHLMLPCTKQIFEAMNEHVCLSKRTVIVSSSLTRHSALILGELWSIPVVIVHLQPLLPNKFFPSYRISRHEFVQACLTAKQQHTYDESDRFKELQDNTGDDVEETYWRIEHAVEEHFLKKPMAELCRAFSIPELDWGDIQTILSGKHRRVWIANCYSKFLFPQLEGMPGVGPNVCDVGPLADDYVAPNLTKSQLPPAIETFLRDCEENPDSPCNKPLCVGFGSMPFQKMQVVLKALQQLNLRAIFVGPALRLEADHPEIQNKRILCISNIPYAQLLPRCSMMLCHGGVGVVQACMRAGIPCMVSPLMGDQFAIGMLVEAKNYGVQCGTNLSKLETNDIVEAIPKARVCVETCQTLGGRIRGESSVGVKRMVSLLSEISSQSSD